MKKSFDELRTNGQKVKSDEKFPFMLRLSKHSVCLQQAASRTAKFGPVCRVEIESMNPNDQDKPAKTTPG